MNTCKLPKFSAADLPITAQGRIYHLDLAPGEVSEKMILVGDPGRAQKIAQEHFSSIEVEREHRGLRSYTGIASNTGKRVSVLTTGMGTPSLEIVLSEIVALHEIDFETRLPKSQKPKLSAVRVGTSGALQADTPLNTLIISTYAIGMDNSGLFYDARAQDAHCERIEKELYEHLRGKTEPGSRFAGRIWPYVSKASEDLLQSLSNEANKRSAAHKLGVTASNAGFFANQGREINSIALSIPDIDQVLSEFPLGLQGQRIENMEMESSFLFHFFGALGHSAASICPVIAHRKEETFAKPEDSQKAIFEATEAALQALAGQA